LVVSLRVPLAELVSVLSAFILRTVRLGWIAAYGKSEAYSGIPAIYNFAHELAEVVVQVPGFDEG
jgi:hypothetical protein